MPPVEQKPASGADSPVAAQAELLRRNRELATLNLCRRHILQACDEVQLLEQVCRAMVEQGGYRMAWVGYPQDDDARSIQPTASAGFVNGYFDDAAIAASRPGPIGAAFRTARFAVVSDLAAEPDLAPWHTGAARRGYASILAVPLMYAGAVAGVLGIYASTPAAFDQAAIGQLSDLADDLAYGIRTLRAGAELRQAVDSAQHFETIANRSRDLLLYMRFETGRILEVNDAAIEAYGYTREEFRKLSILDLRAPGTVAVAPSQMDVARTEGILFTTVHQRKDGITFPVEVSSRGAAVFGGNTLVSVVRDISERLRADDALRASEARFRAVIENSHDNIALWDAQGIMRWRSSPVASGFTREERLGRSIFDRVHPGDLAGFQAAWQDLLLTPGKIVRCQHRISHKDGSYGWADIRFQNLLDNPDVGAIVGTARDITELKRSEQALAASETLYRTLFHAANDVIMLCEVAPTGRPGRFIAANPVAIQTVEYSLEELRLLTPADLSLYPPPDRVEALAEQVKQQSRATFETTLATRSGRRLPVEVSLTRFELDGRLLDFGIARDLTERRRAEDELRASSQRTSSIVACVPETIWTMDLDGRLTYLSGNMVRSYGWSVEDVASLALADVIAPEHLDLALRLVADELDAAATPDYDRNRVVSVELLHRRKQGGPFWAEVRASLSWSDDGKPAGLIGATRDISERKLAEAEQSRLSSQLAQSQKMEAIGRLAGGVAHDFNNLLTVINNRAEMAYSRLLPKDPLRAELDEIVRAGRRAVSLTSQLLAFSRKQVLNPSTLDLNQLVADMHQLIERMLGEDIELQVLLSPQACFIHADRHQFEQVLMNLAVNARDAMPVGGRLRVQTAILDDSPVGPGRRIQLTFSDTGIGMSREVQQRIFEPFFTTKEGSGTGLGLSTVHGIVTQSGGAIEVESDPGAGAAFSIDLPLAGAPIAPVAPAPTPAPAPRTRGSGTVLVVEDQPDVRHIVIAVLDAYGYRVLEAEDGEQALALCQTHASAIDLVLSDAIMPGMSGAALFSRIRELYPRMNILLMSGYTDDVMLRHGISQQEVSFIQKPFTPSELTAKVSAVMAADNGQDS